MNIKQGNLIGQKQKVAIVVARFNEFITSKLLSGTIDGLVRHGVEDENIDVVWVPGAFEIPLIAKNLASNDNYDGVICLGTVIRGATPHFDYVCSEVSKGIAQIAMEKMKPVIFGVITSDTIEQAIERAGTKAGNKGYDAALSFIEMANLMNEI